jgi:hypothetical protein
MFMRAKINRQYSAIGLAILIYPVILCVFARGIAAQAADKRQSSYKIIRPLAEKQVREFLKRLNSQGTVVTYDESVKEDEIRGVNADNLSFYLKGSPTEWYFLYKADINNDGFDEYILCYASGSGGFFRIDKIYKEVNDKLVDIYDEIKIPMCRLIRSAEKASYDLQQGCANFMNGGIKIENEKGKTFFTLEKVARLYEEPGFKFGPPVGFKFLWENGAIELIEQYGIE